ncbi:MAG: hypothetical protein ICV84_15840, partial [Flavisolibacter sp.]|nr:hypothetical protein [Flavisolibacter sp.]
GFTAVPVQQSGVQIRGAVRDVLFIRGARKNRLVIAKNNAPVEVWEQE